MITAIEVKKLAARLGADLCGIAPVERFEGAPQGFRPNDIFPGGRSVIVFARRIPESVFLAESYLPYSVAGDVALRETQRLSFEFAVELEKCGVAAVPIASEPYEYWDAGAMIGKGVLSLKHAGYLAGLGVIGRNSLLYNPEFGNLIKLGAVVADADLAADPVMEFDLCPDTCELCVADCPAGALGRTSVDQKKCRMASEGETPKGVPVTICCRCRKICPNRAGWKRRKIR